MRRRAPAAIQLLVDCTDGAATSGLSGDWMGASVLLSFNMIAPQVIQLSLQGGITVQSSSIPRRRAQLLSSAALCASSLRIRFSL